MRCLRGSRKNYLEVGGFAALGVLELDEGVLEAVARLAIADDLAAEENVELRTWQLLVLLTLCTNCVKQLNYNAWQNSL